MEYDNLTAWYKGLPFADQDKIDQAAYDAGISLLEAAAEAYREWDAAQAQLALAYLKGGVA